MGSNLRMLLSTYLGLNRGAAASLARKIGVRQSQITKWLKGARPVPLEHSPYIEQFTDGAVTCEQLRPDQAEYFALLRSRPPAHALIETPRAEVDGEAANV